MKHQKLNKYETMLATSRRREHQMHRTIFHHKHTDWFLPVKALLVLCLTMLALQVQADAPPAPTYSVSVGTGSFSPNPICGGMTATASLTGMLNVQNPNQEIQSSGDSWGWSASVTGYAPDSKTAFTSPPNGIIPPAVNAPSGSATSNVTATAYQTTSPGYYQVTVSATDSYTLTDSSTNPPTVTPESQSGSTTLEVVVVIVGDIQYNDPQNGWTSVSGPLYDLKGNSITLKAIPMPTDASFPSGYPTWGGSSGASGTGATTTVSPSTLSASTTDYKTITASCGNIDSSNMVVFDLVPQATPTDNTVPNHNSSHIGVGEKLNLSYTTLPPGLGSAQIGNVSWSISGDGAFTSLSPYQYQAGITGGGVTLTLKIMTGSSAGGSRTLTELIFAPTLAYQVNKDGTIYHNKGTASVGFCGWYCISPNDVSFANVQVRETDCTPSTATGSMSGYSVYYHMGGKNGPPVVAPWDNLTFDNSLSAPSWRAVDYDQSGFQKPADTANYPSTGYGTGEADWQIPFSFHVTTGDPSNSSLINAVLQRVSVDNYGTATEAKGGVTVSAKVNDPYVGPFPPASQPLW